MVKTITCVHQGAELYGSDRSFLEVVESLRKIYPDAEIDIILPGDGPLVGLLKAAGFSPRFEPLWILRKSNGLAQTILQIPRLISRVVGSRSVFRGSDIVYINTVVIIDYLLAARFWPGKVINHVREIPTGPARWIFRSLLRWSGATLVFNSQATKDSFALRQEQYVVHNAFHGPNASEAPLISDRPLRVLMLGRINGWKGQDLLVDAISSMSSADRSKFEVRIVGGVFEKQRFDMLLREKIEQQKLEKVVSVEPFVDNPARLYEWCDLVVIPSRKPEPFGRVAIEGMAHARPVLAAGHGGLLEIVTSETGWLFTPNDPFELARALLAAAVDKAAVTRKALRAREAYESHFTLSAMEIRITSALSAWSSAR